MSEVRKHSRPGFLAAAAVIAVAIVLLAYPLSLGPVTRLCNEDFLPEWVGYVYVPLLSVVESSPDSMQAAFEDYINWWLPTP